MSNRRPIVLAGTTIVIAMAALATYRWVGAEPTVRVIPDPAGQRATMLLNAADTALAHGRPQIARYALASAYDQPTSSAEVAYRVARLADELDEVGTAAGAYRRYLAASPASPAAEIARTRLLVLEGSQQGTRAVPARQTVAAIPVSARFESAGETERTHAIAAARRSGARQRPPAAQRSR